MSIFSSIHTVFANTTIDIENGQRMLFKGLLYPSEFIGPDEKTRIRLTTNAFLTKAAFENGSDINHVELYGFIGSNVINNNEGSRFRVVSHHRQKYVNYCLIQFIVHSITMIYNV